MAAGAVVEECSAKDRREESRGTRDPLARGGKAGWRRRVVPRRWRESCVALVGAVVALGVSDAEAAPTMVDRRAHTRERATPARERWEEAPVT